ncbi:CapA family protein [Streptomyces sp. JJ38]|uniref:CapA family protein n=1 Tax=Streptomyces sp. JJ38 TaxID=2738128 RepID=UPI001C5A2B84|nr:CapA family protein [Streptomyces sp. JJ38]MBW1600218.1 CapA family protein [Streptomyces sp. JJ38]
MRGGEVATLFLCGDVMLGRGVDAVLPHPGDPGLRERYVRDAGVYVELAETANGAVPRPVDFAWPWGDALEVLDEAAPDVRVLNLETSVTRSDDFDLAKGVNYRMNPANLPCLAAVRPDVCALANNHVLDFGRSGLRETLDSLAAAGLCGVGAGLDVDEARRPAVVPLADGDRPTRPGREPGGRVLVVSFGMPTSGIPPGWAATADRPGVHLVPDGAYAEARAVTERVRRVRRPGDIVVASVHWGSNWGYRVSRDQRGFAHALVDGGVDVVHGHSSHHPRPVEVYDGRLVLYGCGDFVNDYEGITGYEEYRDDLRLLYLASVARATGRLTELRIVPLRARRLRLWRASSADRAWVRALLDRTGRAFGTRCVAGADGDVSLRIAPPTA